MGACATNNRYLHDNTVILAEKLAKTVPSSLNQLFYTNSGSEANDLAIRLAREYTGNYDILVVDKYNFYFNRNLKIILFCFCHSAYHGHLTSLFELSTYKFKQANMVAKIPEHVHVVCIFEN